MYKQLLLLYMLKQSNSTCSLGLGGVTQLLLIYKSLLHETVWGGSLITVTIWKADAVMTVKAFFRKTLCIKSPFLQWGKRLKANLKYCSSCTYISKSSKVNSTLKTVRCETILVMYPLACSRTEGGATVLSVLFTIYSFIFMLIMNKVP